MSSLNQDEKVAILIHKITKKNYNESGVTFSFKMTPEKPMLANTGIHTFHLGVIDVHQHSDIYIADRDRQTQNLLKNYLNQLEYSNFYFLNNPKNLVSLIKKKNSFFCLCDYRMLKLSDGDFLQIAKESDDVSIPIVALMPYNHQTTFEMSHSNIVGILKKPIQLSSLRKVLFKYMGPPLKKIAQ